MQIGTVLADELSQLRQELLDAANGMVDGKYLFAGYEEDSKPFVENLAYDPLTYDPNDSVDLAVSYTKAMKMPPHWKSPPVN